MVDEQKQQSTMDKVVALAKRRGFIYPGSEIYGGLANTYDYGPVGAELLRNLRNLWWVNFVQRRSDMVGLDSSLISHHKIWEASGHVGGFADTLIDCKYCKHRMRADHLIEDYLEKMSDENKNTHYELKKISIDELKQAFLTNKVEGWSEDKLDEFISLFKIICPNCRKSSWTSVRKFNLLFPVHLGIIEGEQDKAYLRGETAQGIFINFKNIIDSTRVKIPFGIAQLGKSFRNEITPGNSVFRTLEFEQAEIEFFFNPDVDNWEKLFGEWKEDMESFVVNELGVKKENLRWREHTEAERSFYSKKTEDLEYKYPFGFKELWGIAYRSDYDLAQHERFSGQTLNIIDTRNNQKVRPHVIEPAGGINRLLLMVLIDGYNEEENRVVLKLSPKIAPFKAAVFPLLSNKSELVEKAHGVYDILKNNFMVYWDERGNIGKRYLFQDEIGTPYCITVDFQTLEDNTVTIRDRNTTLQERLKVEQLQDFLKNKLA